MRVPAISFAILLGGSIKATAFSAARALHMSAVSSLPESFPFGPYPIRRDHAFLATEQCVCIVNLKPIVPGHVLVLPRRVAPRLADLEDEETSDLFLTARRVASVLEGHYGAEAITMSVQDGPAAGQTVPHVHVHVLPRRSGDFEPNDRVYDELDEAEDEVARSLNLDEDRRPRTPEEMAREAGELRALFLDGPGAAPGAEGRA